MRWGKDELAFALPAARLERRGAATVSTDAAGPVELGEGLACRLLQGRRATACCLLPARPGSPRAAGGRGGRRHCHTRLSEENQVHNYMHARIKFHAHSDIKVNTKTVSRKKKKDHQRFTLNPGNGGSKHHRQSTGGCVRLAPTASSQDFRVASSFWATLFIARVSTCRTQQVWEKNEFKGFIVDWAISI
jgi:hypothetical protein